MLSDEEIDVLIEIITEQNEQIKKATVTGFILGAATFIGYNIGVKTFKFIKDKCIKNKDTDIVKDE